MKTKGLNEAQFLSLLQKVLPQATPDAHLASSIYDHITREMNLLKSVASFEKFCETGSVPDAEPQTVKDLQTELTAKFGEQNVAIVPDENGAAIGVEIALPDRTLKSKIKVDPDGAVEEVKPPFVPFPISLPEDPELVWALGRREDLAPEEAARALAKIEEEFWQTKVGQKLLREHVDRTFAEFIAHVPAAALTESGLKRHYKEPETLQTLRLLPAPTAEELAGALA